MQKQSIMLLLFLLIVTMGDNVESRSTLSSSSSLHDLMTEEELFHFFGHNDRQDIDVSKYEVIHLVKEEDKDQEERTLALPYVRFSAFSRSWQLRMKSNSLLVSPLAHLVEHNEDGESRISKLDDHVANCHFLVHDEQGQVRGGLSHCFQKFTGVLFHNEKERRIYEIKPLGSRLSQMFNNNTSNSSELHLIRHVHEPRGHHDDDEDAVDVELLRHGVNTTMKTRNKRRARASGLMAELAVFVDPDAYRLLMRFFRDDEPRLHASVLAIVNGMQAVYHYPTLGRQLDFTLVRLEVHKRARFSSFGGERNALLDAFCKYQMEENVEEDNDPRHWDASLLMSGVDFYGVTPEGKTSYSTMGLATVTGVCEPRYSCVIGELAVMNRRGYPSPSTGFATIFVMAHEIGHNLGMHHDSSRNSPLFSSCPKNGFVMSPSRGLKGELEWSSCSRSFMADLDLPCLYDTPVQPPRSLDHLALYGNEPGRSFSPDRQCQFALHNRDARKDEEIDNICEETLYCNIPHESGRFRAGPAMDGTRCGRNRICRHGKCISDPGPLHVGSGSGSSSSSSSSSPKGQWSDWSSGSCTFNCIGRSKGVRVEHRECVPESGECRGVSRRTSFCDNVSSKHCGFDIWPNGPAFADEMCRRYRARSRRLELLISNRGHQPKHNPERLQQACTIHCRMVKTPAWYSPQAELSSLANQGNPDDDISLYFPDGTLCHDTGNRDSSLYCLNHVCSNPNAVITARSATLIGEVPLVDVGGVGDDDHPPTEDVEKFFTLDDQDQPLSNHIPDSFQDRGDGEIELDDEHFKQV